MRRLLAAWSLADSSRSFCLRFQMSLFLLLGRNSVVLKLFSLWTLAAVCQATSPSPQAKDSSLHWSEHPGALRLCPQTLSGEEGTEIKGFSMDRVFAVVTPGLVFRKNPYLSIDTVFDNQCHFHLFSQTESSNKVRRFTKALQLKDQILKSKSKPGSPFKMFKKIPDLFECEDNMLTSKGVVQGIQLGEFFAKSYFHRLRSLASKPKQWFDLAYSVGNELLFQTVHGVLYGLLNEKQFVFAGIRKMSHHFSDDKTGNTQSAGDFDYYIEKSFKGEHHIFKDDSSPTSNRKRIEEEFGELSAKDILSSISLSHCDMPVEEDLELDGDLLEFVHSVSSNHNAYLMNSSLFQSYSNSRTLPLRKLIKSWSLLPKNRLAVDFKIVSVDHLFMLSLLSSLGVSSAEHIPPVTRLVIEKFHCTGSFLSRSSPSLTAPSSNVSGWVVEEDEYHTYHPRDTYFRVVYRGRVITQDVWGCSSDPYASLGLCSMPTFFLGLESDSL